MGNKHSELTGDTNIRESLPKGSIRKAHSRNNKKTTTKRHNKNKKSNTNKSDQNESINTDSSTAATKIQGAWKRHNEKIKSDDILTNWKMFNDLENREEADVLELAQFLEALHSYMPKPNLSASFNESNSNNSTSSLTLYPSKHISVGSLGDIDISDLYNGVHLESKITLKNTIDLIESYKKGELLHRKYIIQILTQVTDYFDTLPNIKNVSIAPAPHITLVGDLHGQLDDLLLILRENGYPSETNPYVFNGDFVDRGPFSIEIAAIIFCFQLLYPNSVHINRGNHEDRAITTVFGFMKECHEKYDNNIYEMFTECFQSIPICTLIEKRVLVLHAGISRFDISLDEINALPRKKYELSASAIDIPSKSPEEKKFNQRLEILRDILWSDPQSEKGWKKNRRGAGITFGPDIVSRFIKKNNLQLIVRSHECVPKGYHWPYAERGMVVTLFSASNYCGKANNIGAFMRIPADKNARSCFYQYIAETTVPITSEIARERMKKTNAVVDNLHTLFGVIIEHKEQLLLAFESKDKDHKGSVTVHQWCNIMEDILQMNLKWKTLLPLLTTIEENGVIRYNEFLARYQVEGLNDRNGIKNVDEKIDANHTEKQINKRKIFNNLYKHRQRLEALFQIFDTDNNGKITIEEFRNGIDILNQHLPKEMTKFTNSEELMSLLDFSKDNEININEFMEGFRITAALTLHAKWKRAKSKVRVISKFNLMKNKIAKVENNNKNLSKLPVTSQVEKSRIPNECDSVDIKSITLDDK